VAFLPGRSLPWFVVLVLVVLGCRSQATTRLPDQAPVEDTTLGSGDVFEVRVFGEKDMTGAYQVAANGTIHFPFLGTLDVRGKETSDVAQMIADGLSEGNYLTSPQVSVFLQQSNSKRVSVLGAVAKPGTLPIVPGMTLVHAVSQAGGFTALASKDDTVVTRRVGGKLERYRVEVSKITRGDSEDMPLRAGDIVFVPERVF
jgi:protein involved in polysaccharide export with SLBB domain